MSVAHSLRIQGRPPPRPLHPPAQPLARPALPASIESDKSAPVFGREHGQIGPAGGRLLPLRRRDLDQKQSRPRRQIALGPASTRLGNTTGVISGASSEETAAKPAPAKSSSRQVGDFFFSAMDTNRAGTNSPSNHWPPTSPSSRRSARPRPCSEWRLISTSADLGAMFGSEASPDAKNSGFYAFHLGPGGSWPAGPRLLPFRRIHETARRLRRPHR